jgi:hypothetical protein
MLEMKKQLIKQEEYKKKLERKNSDNYVERSSESSSSDDDEPVQYVNPAYIAKATKPSDLIKNLSTGETRGTSFL